MTANTLTRYSHATFSVKRTGAVAPFAIIAIVEISAGDALEAGDAQGTSATIAARTTIHASINRLLESAVRNVVSVMLRLCGALDELLAARR